MKVSIITPCFNSEKYLEQTIDSVLGQGIENLEYLIIDGGSTDKSLEIIKKYERHLTYWVSERDQGQSHAINKGLNRVTGEIVNWLNSDDYFEEGALTTIIQHFENPTCKVLCGRSMNFSLSTQKLSRGTDVYDQNLEKTIGQARIDQPETWFRREAYSKTGNLSEVLHFLMDREWWIRYLLLNGIEGIVQSEEILVHFRLHENSKTVSQSEHFQVDHDTIFAAMADTYGLESSSQIIRSQFETLDNYTFPELEVKYGQVKNILNYYFLKRSHECYYMGQYEKASALLKCIDASLLDSQSLRLLDRIKFRNSPIISGIRSWLKH